MNATNGNPSSRDRVLELLSAQADGWLGDEQRQELLDLLRSDPNARAVYAEHAILNSLLHQKSSVSGSSAIHAMVGEAAELPPGIGGVESEAPSLSNYPTLSITHYPTSTNFVGGPVFSYMVATVVLCMMLLGAWAYKVSQNDVLPGGVAYLPENNDLGEPMVVGRVTGMKNCRWIDENDGTVIGAGVYQGRKYAFSSGLMEITYRSGARVILEGPCEYTVDSAAGGYLAAGKLTAKVRKKHKWRRHKSGRQMACAKPLAANSEFTATNSRPPVPLFAVRTPTAVVTDLGTEFGVYVDRSGACETYVYQGKVELKIDGDEAGKHTVQLGRGESARVNPDKTQPVKVNREPGQPMASKFRRRMPGLVKLEVFNTGVNLREGDEDPNWQIVARSDDPGFKPRPAVVVPCHESYWRPGDDRSQWISIVPGLVSLPEDVTYTFRTTFRLPRSIPGKTILYGKFMADDHVEAIRLNGQNLDLPRHDYGEGAFTWYHRFKAQSGFVEGVNVIEVDVLNGGCSTSVPGGSSFMALRVELWGTAFTTSVPESESETNPAEQQTENQKTTGVKTALRKDRNSSRDPAEAINASRPIRAEKGGSAMK